MKKSIGLYLVATGLLWLAVACSTKKDAFLNRNLHALSTKYNILYNGQLAFDEAKKQLDDNYKDNFWELLPIEPLKVEEQEVDLPSFAPQKKSESESTAQGFEKAEEKAVKAVQKHGMDIDGHERNRQIDDAYLLLGKARYYSQRFVPALEAFNFLLGHYTDPELRDETRVWQAKTLVKLQNEDLAIETLQLLLDNENLPFDLVEKAHTAMAMAYQTLDSTQLVIRHLDSAVIFSRDANQKSRNLFILGQLYRQENKIDSSNLAFERLAAFKKAPIRYRVHAQIDRAKNFSDKDSSLVFIDHFDKILMNSDNRPFFDELYYQKALIELKNDSTDMAVADLNNSLRSRYGGDFQKELAYEQLGNIYFDKAQFQTAGSYFDSIIQITKNNNDKRVRRIVRKRNGLEEVIRYETVAKTNDSILTIAALPKEEQEAFYNNYIEQLKEAEEIAKRKLEQNEMTTGFGTTLTDDDSKSSAGGKFYFYNLQVAGFGKQGFKKVWGNRPLEDNWRLSNKSMIASSDPFLDVNQANVTDNSKKYDLQYYLDRIPTDKTAIDSITATRNDAYFKLGVIYEEQFKEYQLAIQRLEKLLSFHPDQKLELPANYHLYKIYSIFDLGKDAPFKELIVKKYPDSRYAAIIVNPEQALLSADDSPEAVYNDAFCDYDYYHYARALEKINSAVATFTEQPIVAKFELLKAFVFLKTEGREAFKDALNFVALNYPNSEEGKYAVSLLGKVSVSEENQQ